MLLKYIPPPANEEKSTTSGRPQHTIIIKTNHKQKVRLCLQNKMTITIYEIQKLYQRKKTAVKKQAANAERT